MDGQSEEEKKNMAPGCKVRGVMEATFHTRTVKGYPSHSLWRLGEPSGDATPADEE